MMKLLPKTITSLIIFMGLLAMIKFLSGCSDSSLFYSYGYNIRHGKVYYKRPFPDGMFLIENADAGSFKIIPWKDKNSGEVNENFATDKKSVYYRGHILTGSDGPSFKLLDANYSKDNHQCYYEGILISGADPASFVIKNDHFSADEHHIFKREFYVDTAASVFQTFENTSVLRTANTVIIYDDIVPIPPGAMFHHFGNNYFSLDEQVYFRNEKMPDADVKSFVAIDDFYSRSAKHVYYGSDIITGADPATHTLLASPYSRDNKHIFFFEKIIEGADVSSFEIINIKFQCARDKNAAYHENRKINAFSSADLLNKNVCTSCNENALYFAE